MIAGSLEARPDVLVYSTPALTADLEVVGPLSATLYVATSAPDTDFTAALVDVFPDGFAQLVQEGIVRLGSVEHDIVSSGDGDGVHELTVDLCATGHRFAAGHAVRLEVSSSNFGRYDRNLNTGGAPGLAVRRAVAEQTIYHDGRRPSCLTLPVVPGRRSTTPRAIWTTDRRRKPMQARTTWLSDAEKKLVYDEALLLLERVGLRMAGSRHLAALREAGAGVDVESGVVRFPAALSTGCAANVRARS